MTIEQFVDKLSKVDSTHNMYNPYTDPIRANNLLIYLTYLQSHKPKHILIGEAPGHGGCRWTGIPFTDEYRLTEEGSNGCLPLLQDGYRIVSDKPHKEQSATFIWNVLSEKAYYPVLWNVFPFHPHNPGDDNSNRTPTPDEVDKNKYVLTDLLSLFRP